MKRIFMYACSCMHVHVSKNCTPWHVYQCVFYIYILWWSKTENRARKWQCAVNTRLGQHHDNSMPKDTYNCSHWASTVPGRARWSAGCGQPWSRTGTPSPGTWTGTLRTFPTSEQNHRGETHEEEERSETHSQTRKEKTSERKRVRKANSETTHWDKKNPSDYPQKGGAKISSSAQQPAQPKARRQLSPCSRAISCDTHAAAPCGGTQ